MRFLLLTLFFFLEITLLKAQAGDSIVTELKSINRSVLTNGAVISNRAMNIFMADKTGYLSESTDLSLYTNYVTVNTSEGRITVNHNFQKTSGTDEPIKRLFSIGVAISIPNNFSTTFLDKRYDNGLGFIAGYKWLGKVKTRFADRAPMPNSKNQKQSMDALRAVMFHSLEMEIHNKEAAFKIALNAFDTSDVPAQNVDTAKAALLQSFYNGLKEEYEKKFAQLQAETLTRTNNFKLITTSWTGINLYIPVISPTYIVAPSLTTVFQSKYSYPAKVMLLHTMLWESSMAGRFFLTLGGGFFFNNSKLSYGLDKITFTEYQNMGGTDTLHTTALNNNKAYIGYYQSFVTPVLQGRFVYFPPGSHVGISFLLEQNFGTNAFLNGRLSIPVVLINSKGTPAVNFDFYFLFTDLNNKIALNKRPIGKTTIGVSAGLPLSRLMY